MVPLVTLVWPYFIIYNDYYYEQKVRNQQTYDSIAYAVEPISKWGDNFFLIYYKESLNGDNMSINYLAVQI